MGWVGHDHYNFGRHSRLTHSSSTLGQFSRWAVALSARRLSRTGLQVLDWYISVPV